MYVTVKKKKKLESWNLKKVGYIRFIFGGSMAFVFFLNVVVTTTEMHKFKVYKMCVTTVFILLECILFYFMCVNDYIAWLLYYFL